MCFDYCNTAVVADLMTVASCGGRWTGRWW